MLFSALLLVWTRPGEEEETIIGAALETVLQAKMGEVTDAWQIALGCGRKAMSLCGRSLMTRSWRVAGLADVDGWI